ncbi:MAG: type II toxin-antitoxin system RelE/ParE family toxin [Candidatus Omnitrophota bacterium]
MPFSIYYFVDERGQKPVKEFIDSLPWKEQAKVMAYLVELWQQGHNLRRPMSDYLKEGIYELRPKDNRIFYFFFHKDSIVLLHASRKRTDKIPPRDLTLCFKRKSQVEELKHIEKLEL